MKSEMLHPISRMPFLLTTGQNLCVVYSEVIEWLRACPANCLKKECVAKTESRAEKDGVKGGLLPSIFTTRMTSHYVSEVRPGVFECNLGLFQNPSRQNWDKMLLVRAKRKLRIENDQFAEESLAGEDQWSLMRRKHQPK